MLTFLLTIVYCLPLALQLSGALVLISAMKSIDQVINSLLSQSTITVAVFDSSKKNLKLDPKKLQTALENNYYQKFAMWYILLGYLSAVLFADHAPSGFTDALIVAFCTIAFLSAAIFISKFVSKKVVSKHETIPADQAPEGTLAFDLQD